VRLAVGGAANSNEHVIGCGPCTKEATRALRAREELHHLAIRGLVDRDHRNEQEVAALQESGIAVPDVAEVEGLYCLPEVLLAVARQSKSEDPVSRVEAAKRAVWDEFSKQIGQQSLERALAQVQFGLAGFGPRIAGADVAGLEAELVSHVERLNVSAVATECRTRLEGIVSERDYGEALKHFNCKGLITFVTRPFGLRPEAFITMVNGLIRDEPDGEVAQAMRNAIKRPDAA